MDYMLFASVIKGFLTEELHKKIIRFFVNFKKSVLGPAVFNPPRGITPKTKI